MTDPQQPTEVARFYTRSRRFPRLIGRLHDGTRIPGGPYTVTQGVVGAVLLILGLATRGLWGTGTILLDIPIVLLAAWGGAWGAGRLPATRRNVFSILLGTVGAMVRPAAGKYRERTVRMRPPHRASGVTVVGAAQEPSTIRPVRSVAAATVTVGDVPAPLPARPVTVEKPATRMPVTGVERLLAQARGSGKE